ncbi:MAG: DUF2304 family protein [Acidobacteriota bacterium]
MALIKPILLFFVLYIFFKYIFKNKSALATRILSIAMLGTATLFVLFPNLSTDVANLIGVGRGVDMLIYLFMCLVTMFFFRIYSKTKELDQLITSIVRHSATTNALRPTG